MQLLVLAPLLVLVLFLSSGVIIENLFFGLKTTWPSFIESLIVVTGVSEFIQAKVLNLPTTGGLNNLLRQPNF